MNLLTQPIISQISQLHKVLVIDDNPIIQRAVYFALRDHGCIVLMCGNVTEALGLMRREQPELVVLDINFPPDGGLDGERDGFWALTWMHQVEEVKNIPVIMISSDDPLKSRIRALAAGAAAFLQKPVNKEELVRLVMKFTGQKPVHAAPAV
jgi:CheY-like chemotaxis protein